LLIAGLFALKGAVLFLVSHFARLPLAERPLFILLLAQGGEFAFVILGLGATNGALAEDTAQAITLAVALSMIATPFFLLATTASSRRASRSCPCARRTCRSRAR